MTMVNKKFDYGHLFVQNKPMSRSPQQRTLKTRGRLVDAAKDLIRQSGYAALRVEEVVLKAGVAKGTFFAHFPDKDALMDQLIGAEMHRILDEMAALPGPKDADAVTKTLMPLLEFMTSERYVMDICLRYSGASGIEDIGPVAETFGRQFELFTDWAKQPNSRFRNDIDPDLLAEGIQAFAIQAMATKFCALHNAVGIADRLRPYLTAWLHPVR